jgi:hypothetical protein
MLASIILPALSTRWWLKLISPLADIEPMMGGRLPGRSLISFGSNRPLTLPLSRWIWKLRSGRLPTHPALARHAMNQPISVEFAHPVQAWLSGFIGSRHSRCRSRHRGDVRPRLGSRQIGKHKARNEQYGPQYSGGHLVFGSHSDFARHRSGDSKKPENNSRHYENSRQRSVFDRAK